MPGPGTGYTVTFTVAEGDRLDTVLDREVAAAMAAAYPQGLGVLVTRRDARTFTVEASPEVPVGIVRERDLFARTPAMVIGQTGCSRGLQAVGWGGAPSADGAGPVLPGRTVRMEAGRSGGAGALA